MKTLGVIAEEMRQVSDLRGVAHHMMKTRQENPSGTVEAFSEWYADLVRTLLDRANLPPVWSDVYGPRKP